MDASFNLQGQAFEWDLRKAAANRRKHGVEFEEACEVFFDPFVKLADAGTASEDRQAAIGFTEDTRMLVVVHVQRRQDGIRIISARQANKAERRVYEHE